MLKKAPKYSAGDEEEHFFEPVEERQSREVSVRSLSSERQRVKDNLTREVKVAKSLGYYYESMDGAPMLIDTGIQE